MHEADFDQLSLIAQELDGVPQWKGLGHFFELRGKGLRGPAFAKLDEFLDSSKVWSFEDRLRITRWLSERCGCVEETLLLPQPLLASLVSPTLWDWLRREPLSAEAHYLVATLAIWPPNQSSADRYIYLEQAIALDPVSDRAREKLVQWLTGEVEYNQHELPRFYIGDAAGDVADLGKAEMVANGICDPKLRAWAQDHIRSLRHIATSWLAFHDSGKTDFAAWCSDSGRI